MSAAKGTPLGAVLVVGMSRSGTTVVADVLSEGNRVHVEMEPHLIWKAGDFGELGDGDHPRDDGAYGWIYRKLTEASADRLLVEKSPPNCLRPKTVYRVLPNARVIYVVRRPEECVYSNYRKSSDRAALSPSIAIRKYLLGSKASNAQKGAFDADRQAVGGRLLWKQVRVGDAKAFAQYSAWLWRLRQRGAALPFGPKLDDFGNLVRDVGLLGYYARCLQVASEKALVFRELYGEAMRVVALEDLVTKPETIVREIFDFAQCEVGSDKIDRIIEGLGRRAHAQSLPADFTDAMTLAASAGWSEQIALNVAALR